MTHMTVRISMPTPQSVEHRLHSVPCHTGAHRTVTSGHVFFVSGFLSASQKRSLNAFPLRLMHNAIRDLRACPLQIPSQGPQPETTHSKPSQGRSMQGSVETGFVVKSQVSLKPDSSQETSLDLNPLPQATLHLDQGPTFHS